MTTDEYLMATDGVDVLQNGVNDIIYEEISKTVNISLEIGQGLLNLFTIKLSIVILQDHLGHVTDLKDQNYGR